MSAAAAVAIDTGELQYSRNLDLQVKGFDGSEGQFQGYVSCFGGPPDRQGDIIEYGAFTQTIGKSGGRVPILMGHMMSRIVGFGISAEEDEKGLKVVGEFTMDSDEGRNAYATVKHAVKLNHPLGLSIGYMIRKNGATWDEATGIRTIKSVDLLEYSIAAVPAAPRARVTAVKCATVREAERFLRQQGLTHNEAREFIALCRTERDVKSGADEDSDQERDVNDLNRKCLATLRQMSIHHELTKEF